MSRLLDKYKTRKNHKESTGFEFDYEAHGRKTEEEEEMEHNLQQPSALVGSIYFQIRQSTDYIVIVTTINLNLQKSSSKEHN